jgi:hypothetical protein
MKARVGLVALLSSTSGNHLEIGGGGLRFKHLVRGRANKIYLIFKQLLTT